MDYKALIEISEYRAAIFHTKRDEGGYIHEENCQRALWELLARAEAAEAELEQKEKYYGQMVDALAATDSMEFTEAKRKLEAAEERCKQLEKENNAWSETCEILSNLNRNLMTDKKEAEERAEKAEQRVKKLDEAMEWAKYASGTWERAYYNAMAREGKAEMELAAAVSDLETVMAYGAGNLDTCKFCKNAQCYARGGTKPCLPKWRGPEEE